MNFCFDSILLITLCYLFIPILSNMMDITPDTFYIDYSNSSSQQFLCDKSIKVKLNSTFRIIMVKENNNNISVVEFDRNYENSEMIAPITFSHYGTSIYEFKVPSLSELPIKQTFIFRAQNIGNIFLPFKYKYKKFESLFDRECNILVKIR